MEDISETEIEEFAAEHSFAHSENVITNVQKSLDVIDVDWVTGEKDKESVGIGSDDTYNALLEVYPEPRSGLSEGTLSDLTFVVKDNIAVKDLKSTCGVEQFSYVPDEDAVVVERLLEEGAELIGKANMEPFGFGPTGERSEFGAVINPKYDDRITGGSSSGSAAAVTADIVDFSLGTDTGGSVRVPAACCGLVGVKPTHGIVPRYGLVDLVPWTDTIGPIARDVETATKVLDTIAGYDIRDPSSKPMNESISHEDLDVFDHLTIGLVEPLLESSEKAVVDTTEVLEEKLNATSRVTVQRVSIDVEHISECYSFYSGEFARMITQNGILRGQGTGYNEGFRRAFTEYVETYGFSDYISSRVLPAAIIDSKTNGKSYVTLRRQVVDFKRELQSVFNEVDVLLTPTLRRLPPKYGEIGVYEGALDLTGNTVPFSLAGTPAVSVPIGEYDGLPVSVQVIAPEYQDHRAFQIASTIEKVANFDR